MAHQDDVSAILRGAGQGRPQQQPMTIAAPFNDVQLLILTASVLRAGGLERQDAIREALALYGEVCIECGHGAQTEATDAARQAHAARQAT